MSNSKSCIEHMEDDEPTSSTSDAKSIPPWVKLEYTVGLFPTTGKKIAADWKICFSIC